MIREIARGDVLHHGEDDGFTVEFDGAGAAALRGQAAGTLRLAAGLSDGEARNHLTRFAEDARKNAEALER